MDWNLRSCARHGHVTYAPTEAEYRQRLHALTPVGDAWRCLRCGDYVLGHPHGDGPAEDAPVLLRGKALRSAFILRLLAIERWVRGAIMLLLGVAVLRFKSTQVSVKELVDRDLASLKPFFNQINFNVSDSGTIQAIQRALDANPTTLNLVAAFLIFYGLLQLVEGTGLWMLKRWGEYFAVVATSVFIPLEIYEVSEKVTLLRVGALIINIAAVAYLLYSKRLFGLRGGVKAYEADLEEVSLLEVTTSAGTSSGGGASAGSPPAGDSASATAG
ncbi:Uncharacterized membrane protein, DUF2068 family [Frankineae bacterium MT45]|nr:Uncharacterized membrane protein, DUF2068 family [Frankineae bacterium MT45]